LLPCTAIIGGVTAFSPASSSVSVICCIKRASGSAQIVAGENAYCEPDMVFQRGMM
jgi:hypothetical protein